VAVAETVGRGPSPTAALALMLTLDVTVTAGRGVITVTIHSPLSPGVMLTLMSRNSYRATGG